ncbi:MAG: hypothetical protein ACI93R_004154, partial [Flavobacteriales bacterium]
VGGKIKGSATIADINALKRERVFANHHAKGMAMSIKIIHTELASSSVTFIALSVAASNILVVCLNLWASSWLCT